MVQAVDNGSDFQSYSITFKVSLANDSSLYIYLVFTYILLLLYLMLIYF